MALEEPEAADDEGGDGLFEDAAGQALDLLDKGDKAGAVAALKSAVEACVADYMASDSEEAAEE